MLKVIEIGFEDSHIEVLSSALVRYVHPDKIVELDSHKGYLSPLH